MNASEGYDVVILGGGLAGLCLALQLKRARPQTSVLVAEKSAHPVSEAAHKVGESTSELAAHYFTNVIGMQEHLDTQQLRKCALRFFFPAGDNSDITRRIEVGARAFPPVHTYQIDRGRFENALGLETRHLGAEFWDRCKVEQVTLGRDGEEHRVVLDRGGRAVTVQARWVVDASGRAALLKRQLGLAKPVSHAINAAWFRIGEPINVDDWSDDPDWQARVPDRVRYLSTNHLLGRGYWVWLIPLSSGSHSIGICADPSIHPFEEINTFERSMDWLRRHEPQLAKEIEQRLDSRQDFRVLKHFAFSSERVYSTDRWCLTGEAGLFNDPFYSPGSDNIALSNTFVTELITRELNGESAETVNELIDFFDEAFRSAFDLTWPVWEGIYPELGNAQVFTAKHIYDAIIYWGFIAQLFYRGKFGDPEFLASVLPDISTMAELTGRVQSMFRDWDLLEQREWQDAFVQGRGGAGVDFLSRLLNELQIEASDDEIRARISDNLALLEVVAVEMFRKAARLVAPIAADQAINAYAISLSPVRWQADGLFLDGDPPARSEHVAKELEKIWLDNVAGVSRQ